MLGRPETILVLLALLRLVLRKGVKKYLVGSKPIIESMLRKLRIHYQLEYFSPVSC